MISLILVSGHILVPFFDQSKKITGSALIYIINTAIATSEPEETRPKDRIASIFVDVIQESKEKYFYVAVEKNSMHV